MAHAGKENSLKNSLTLPPLFLPKGLVKGQFFMTYQFSIQSPALDGDTIIHLLAWARYGEMKNPVKPFSLGDPVKKSGVAEPH